jgi:3-oxoacyl-[acyl-carrier protein] reductase
MPTISLDLKGTRSLVTGAARGIGQAVSVALARAGSSVLACDVIPCDETIGIIDQGGGQGTQKKFDVTSREEVDKAIQDEINNAGGFDIVVNNAGVTHDSLFVRMSPEAWKKVLSVNLDGPFNVTKAVIRDMMKRRKGRIINIASVIGEMGNAGQTNYAASKAGLIGFTKALAREVCTRGITVNAVAPGFISTPMTDKLPDEVKEQLLTLIPLGRFGDTEDIVGAVLFLVSGSAAYITGHVLDVNGGMYM